MCIYFVEELKVEYGMGFLAKVFSALQKLFTTTTDTKNAESFWKLQRFVKSLNVYVDMLSIQKLFKKSRGVSFSLHTQEGIYYLH